MFWIDIYFSRLSNGSEFIKIAKKSNINSDDDELEKLARKIRSEVRATPKPGDYNLSDYVRHKVTGSTSAATLLNLVFSLVSGGAINVSSVHSAAHLRCWQKPHRNYTTSTVIQSSSRLPMSMASQELMLVPIIFYSYMFLMFWSF